jgi:hypothetical protein
VLQALNRIAILGTFIAHQGLQAKLIIFNLMLKTYRFSNVSCGKDCSSHLVPHSQGEAEQSKDLKGTVIFQGLKEDQKLF